jgi:hypothetical protein
MLLICPVFHGYEYEIQRAFERNGFSVDLMFYNEHRLIGYRAHRFPFVLLATAYGKLFENNKTFIELLNRLKEWAKDPRPFHVEMARLLKQKKETYDWGLIVKGYGWNTVLVKILRRLVKGPVALYQWDPVTRFPSLFSVYPLLDAVIVFQAQDVNRFPNTTYLPTFYLPRYSVFKRFNPRRKLAFVGYYSHDRYRILNRLASCCAKNDISADFILVARFPTLNYRRYPSLTVRGGFVSRREVETVYFDSAAIVDIPKPSQDGLTQRVFEALAAGRKVITCAKDYREWPLYNRDWIMSVSQFYKNGYKWLTSEPISTIDMTDYSIDNWARRIWQITVERY